MKNPLEKDKGFTLVELLIVCAIGGIVVAIAVDMMSGNSILPSRQSCTSQGGQWISGIQYGHITQLCTYN